MSSTQEDSMPGKHKNRNTKGRKERLKKRGITQLNQLTEGRPPLAPKPQATLSKKATQTAIRSHHDLNKKLAKAKADGDEGKAAELTEAINASGGLSTYQIASIQGQSNDRGGDASKILIQWLGDIKPALKSSKAKLRMLEVGALSTQNACSKSRLFEITRIDLNTPTEGITKQDFMERPIPKYEKDQFDIISLSLVINFVPDATDRGEMLKRTCQFLDQRAPRTFPKDLQDHFPSLFLVLPASCITNSRYMNEERLTLMMASLGYVLLKRKQTIKLVYYLWLLRDRPNPYEQNFPKRVVCAGGGRNNFSIVLAK
jgi:25S rRNA (adenine2142-N1)-methyltransferase